MNNLPQGYGSWIDALFQLPAISMSQTCSLEKLFTAEQTAEYALHFMRSPLAPLKSISRDDAIAGLHNFPSTDGCLGLISYEPLRVELRVALARTQYEIFRTLFFFDDYDGAGFMWWERLLGASWLDYRKVRHDEYACSIIMETVLRIGKLKSPICIKSALHGIHETAVALTNQKSQGDFIKLCQSGVNAVLLAHDGLSKEILDYASIVRSGEAQ